MVVTKDNVKIGDKVVFTEKGKYEYYFFLTCSLVKRLGYGVIERFEKNDVLFIKFVDYKGFPIRHLHVQIVNNCEYMLEFYEELTGNKRKC